MYEFSEIQRFRQWWTWLIVLSAVALSSFGIYMTVIEPAGELGTMDYTQVLVSIAGVGLIVLLMLTTKLETRVNGTGIYYRFFPFHLTERHITWDEVESTEVREYDPIREYGGWGIRYSFRKGRALNIAGNMGLQLLLKNKKKLLIGTQKAEELMVILREIGKGTSV